MHQDKSHYSLANAAELVKCKPQDLLHYAVQRKIVLLTGVPDGIDLRTYDEVTNETGIPFLLKPQLLTLMQSYCLKIELNGKTEQSDFKEGYILDSSGELKRLLPSYGLPELNHRWAAWRTFQGETVKNLELIPERLFVMHSDLIQLIESKVKPEESGQVGLKTPKTKKSDLKEVKTQRAPTEIINKEPGNCCRDPELNHRETQPNSIVVTKQHTGQREDYSNSLAKSAVIIRLKQVQTQTGLSRSTIYDKLNLNSPRHDPKFPKQIHIGADAVGWIESEVQAWIEYRITSSRIDAKCGEVLQLPE